MVFGAYLFALYIPVLFVCLVMELPIVIARLVLGRLRWPRARSSEEEMHQASSTSPTRKVQRFFVTHLGRAADITPLPIAFYIVTLFIGVVLFAPGNIVGESAVYRGYAAACEFLFGECGNTVVGFSRTDALYATEEALQERLPRYATGAIVGNRACWGYVDHSDVSVVLQKEHGRFAVLFGTEDDFGFVPTSGWIAVPPAAGDGWQIMVEWQPEGLPIGASCD